MTIGPLSLATAAKCLETLVVDYLPCPGRYCARLLLNDTQCLFSACQRCPRGYRPSRLNDGNGGGLSVCQPCTAQSSLYDYLYIMFAFNLVVLFNLIFIDNALQNVQLKKLKSHR